MPHNVSFKPKPQPKILSVNDVLSRQMPYQDFIPRLKNLAEALGFRDIQTLPSRAVCSDETQGVVTDTLAAYFGIYPFDFGRVGGMIATDRSPAASHHGDNLVIVAASHIGYNPAEPDIRKAFGRMPRPRKEQTPEGYYSLCCGKILGITSGFKASYFRTTRKKINLIKKRIVGQEKYCVVINNQLLLPEREKKEILTLNYAKMLKPDAIDARVNATVFEVSDEFAGAVGREKFQEEKVTPIGSLSPEYFTFEESRTNVNGNDYPLAQDLIPYMNRIVSSDIPELAAVNVAAWHEFGKAVSDFRARSAELEVDDTNMLVVSGINLDVYYPEMAKANPLLANQVYFCPIGAFIKTKSNPQGNVLEMEEIWEALMKQSAQAKRFSIDELVSTAPKRIGMHQNALKIAEGSAIV